MPPKTAPLPPYTRVFGPVAQARVVRLIVLYLVIASCGFALSIFSHNSHAEAFGLGLVLPGGGFLSHYDLISPFGLWHLATAISVAGLFLLALGVWFGTGNVLAPPAVWLGAAVWAGLMNHGATHNLAVPTVFGITGLLVLGLLVATVVRYALAGRQRTRDNAYLMTATFEAAEDDDETPEMTLGHLQCLRFALDRALQPIEAFEGFERLDQFQTAAIRYQINFLAYAIALSQARFTPAFAGYMCDAQGNLIDKQAEKRVWRYWALENLWGNLSLDDNPIGRENIMFTGFIALQMALLKANGANDFTVADRFRLNDRLAFCDADLIARLESEMARSAFTLFACEPNWIYPLCNTVGASAIQAHDGVRWDAIADDFRTALDSEFLDAFARFVPCRSARTGLSLPAIGGAMPLAMPCFFLNTIAPDIGRRQWLLLRQRLFDKNGRFRRRAFWPIDTGNYGFSRASAYTATALAAAELGDREVYEACLSALSDECPPVLKDGVIHRPRASVWSHGVELMARATVKDSFRRLITTAGSDGPKLVDLPYPQVLVAAAHYVSGELRAVLYGDGVFEAGLTGLKANGRYLFRGAMSGSLIADGTGKIAFTVRLDGRTVLRVTPEEDLWPAA